MDRPATASPAEIFFRLLDRLEDRVHGAKKAKTFREEEFANATRTELFNLEGWAKLHRYWSNPDERRVFAKIRKQSKELEDAIGAMTLAQEIARDLRKKKAEVLALRFDQRAEDAFQNLKATLKKRDWLSHRVHDIRLSLADLEWPSTEAQSQGLIEAMRNECLHLETRYIKELRPDLLKDHYTRKILEERLHKFRRQLRWISMYFQIAEGLVALQPIPKKLSTEDRKLVSDYKGDAFAILPTQFKAVAHIDTVAFYELTRLIEILGAAKDPAERYFQVKDLVDTPEEARAIYGDAPDEVPKEAHPILKEYERKNPLKSLAASLMEHR